MVLWRRVWVWVRGLFGRMSCPAAVSVMQSWLPWCPATDVTQNVPCCDTAGWAAARRSSAGCGQFAVKEKKPTDTLREGEEALTVTFQGQRDFFFPKLLVSSPVSPFYLFFTFAVCPFHRVVSDHVRFPTAVSLPSALARFSWVWSFRVWSLITFMRDQQRRYYRAFVCRLVSRGAPWS